MAIAGKSARVRVMNTTSPSAFTNQATTADSTNTRYTITNDTFRYWSRLTPVTVERSTDSGATWTAVTSGFRIGHAGGVVLFDAAQDPTHQIRVSGQYVTVTTAALVREYTFAINDQIENRTSFDDEGWHRKMITLIDASGTLTGFYDVDNFLQDRILAGTPLVIELDYDSEDASGEYLSFYALLSSHEAMAAVAGLVDTSVPWETDDEVFVVQK